MASYEGLLGLERAWRGRNDLFFRAWHTPIVSKGAGVGTSLCFLLPMGGCCTGTRSDGGGVPFGVPPFAGATWQAWARNK